MTRADAFAAGIGFGLSFGLAAVVVYQAATHHLGRVEDWCRGGWRD